MKHPAAPPHDCPLCPRLAAFRADNRKKYPDWFNAPVPSFGPLDARILIAGLAPGLQGANRTGRPFTGDWARDLLYATLNLVDGRIAKAVRCVPPQNKPEPSEIKTCRQFLKSELESLPNVKVILALGKIAHDSVLTTLGAKISAHPFKHGVTYDIGKFKLISSYHCSRYNTNTGRLTTPMFEDVVKKAK